MLQEVGSCSFYLLCCILISFFVLLPSLKHMSERQWGYIYRPCLRFPPWPLPCCLHHLCHNIYVLSERYILVGKIYPCRKDISFHNITSGVSPFVQHKISFFRQQYNKSLFIFVSFFPLCSITDLPLERSNLFCNDHLTSK